MNQQIVDKFIIVMQIFFRYTVSRVTYFTNPTLKAAFKIAWKYNRQIRGLYGLRAGMCTLKPFSHLQSSLTILR